MSVDALTVTEIHVRLQEVVVAGFPGPVWVRGEVSGFRRTANGAVFFRLVDPENVDTSLDVAARGRVMLDIDRALSDAGLGALRDGVEVRVRGTIGVDSRRSVVRLSVLSVDPTFTAGRMAVDKEGLLRRLAADGSLRANGSLPLPLVPLRIGLVTSRGSAAHADFLDQLRRSGYRFAVRTIHTPVQGEAAAERIVAALGELDATTDMVAVVRGGGSKLDLAVFDTESVARAIAGMTVPVIVGIGHDIDRTVADDTAAVSEKTPSAAGEWLVTRVREFADRIDKARQAIRDETRAALRRHHQLLGGTAGAIAGTTNALARQRDVLDRIQGQITETSRDLVARHRTALDGLDQWFSAVDVAATLRRGFALVTRDGTTSVIRSVDQVKTGDVLVVRLSDGTVRVTVDR